MYAPTSEAHAQASISSNNFLWRFIPRLDRSSSKAIMVLDKGGVIRFQSLPLKWILGYRPKDITGDLLLDHIQQHSKKVAQKALARMTEQGERFSQWRFCFRSASGGKQWLEGKAVNFLKDPRLAGIMVYWEEMKR